MPKTVFRIVAAAVLGLAVPVQGMASVVAGQCMAFGHHQDGGGAGHSHPEDAADGHDHAAHPHADEAGAKPDHEDGKSAHCGPCAACCASASIAGSIALPIPSAPSNAKYLFSQLSPPGVEPHGFDRPPLAL